jgi:hypothetical protein
VTWYFHEQIPFVLSSILPLPGTDPLLSLCQLIAPLPLSSITLSNCAITVALLVCAVVTVYPAQFPAWINALHALHSCDFTRCVRQTAKVRVREAPSDASGGAVAAADQRPAKRRLGEVEPGVFTIQRVVGHELMDDGFLGGWVKWKHWSADHNTLEPFMILSAPVIGDYAKVLTDKRLTEILATNRADFVSCIDDHAVC